MPLVLLLLAGPAGATIYIDQWFLTSYGSSHVVLNDNHLVADRWDRYGRHNGWPIDDFLPWFCQVAGIQGGDNNGTPMRIYLAPPLGHGVGCYAGTNQSTMYGWHNGRGHYEGQRFNHWPVEVRTWNIPGRNPASPDAYGSVYLMG